MSQRKLAPWLSSAPPLEKVGRVTPRVPPGNGEPRHRLTRDQRREQLLAASLAAFASRGVELTTMDTIAGQAGVSKPLVYRHFANRVEALLAVVEQQSAALMSALEDAAAGGGGLHPLIVEYLAFAERSPQGFRLLFHMVDGSAGPARRRLRQLREQLENSVLMAVFSEVGAPEELAEEARRAGLGSLLVSILEAVAGSMHAGDDHLARAETLSRLLAPDRVLSSLLGQDQRAAQIGQAV